MGRVRVRERQADPTGVVTFGGYSGMPAAHHITLRDLQFLGSLTGSSTSVLSPSTDHAIYVSKAAGGPHDLVFEDITVDGSGGLASAIQFYSHDDVSSNAWNVWIRKLTVSGTQRGLIIWDSTLHDIVVDSATVTGALAYGVQYEQPGADIFLANVTTVGSGEGGFHSSLGNAPPGLVFIDSSFQ